jgi:DNA damage-binding protein 1
LGITSIPRTLCYLGTGTVFVGSTYGDAQLIRLSEEPDDEGCCVEVLEEYVNIGPITDMCVVESGTQGQSQLVLCSGAYKDGSLRVVRAGIGINEQASIEAPGIKGLWRLAAGSPHDKFLVQSFIGETRVLMFEGEELGEAEIAGFATEQSLFCSDVAGACLLQVTPSAARLVCATSLELLDSYHCDSTISVAVAQGAHAVLASSGGKVSAWEPHASSDALLSHLTRLHPKTILKLTPLLS